MKLSTAVFASILSLSVSAMADITLTNGADLDMNGSAGSTIIFQDGSVLSTATGQGADGATGPKGGEGSSGSHMDRDDGELVPGWNDEGRRY